MRGVFLHLQATSTAKGWLGWNPLSAQPIIWYYNEWVKSERTETVRERERERERAGANEARVKGERTEEPIA